jgi:hypothetical protein
MIHRRRNVFINKSEEHAFYTNDLTMSCGELLLRERGDGTVTGYTYSFKL